MYCSECGEYLNDGWKNSAGLEVGDKVKWLGHLQEGILTVGSDWHELHKWAGSDWGFNQHLVTTDGRVLSNSEVEKVEKNDKNGNF